MPYATNGTITANILIHEHIYRMEIECADIAKEAKPGQFIQIRTSDHLMPLLNRPISIARIKDNRIEIIYAVVGEGTKNLCEMKTGATVSMVGPLGHGFETNLSREKVLLVGGGMGVAPLHALAEVLYAQGCEIDTILGFNRQEDIFSDKEFEHWSNNVYVTTMDGSCGIHGHACTPLDRHLSIYDYRHIYACGPQPMLHALGKICNEHHIDCSLSVEEYMACGIGVCLGCVQPIRDKAGSISYQRVCVEGPVFSSREVVYDDELGH